MRLLTRHPTIQLQLLRIYGAFLLSEFWASVVAFIFVGFYRIRGQGEIGPFITIVLLYFIWTKSHFSDVISTTDSYGSGMAVRAGCMVADMILLTLPVLVLSLLLAPFDFSRLLAVALPISTLVGLAYLVLGLRLKAIRPRGTEVVVTQTGSSSLPSSNSHRDV